jgi:hypothetical protein
VLRAVAVKPGWGIGGSGQGFWINDHEVERDATCLIRGLDDKHGRSTTSILG